MVQPAGTDALYFGMRQNSGIPIYSRHPTEGHGGFDEMYQPGSFRTDSPVASGGSGQDLYQWMFAKTLDGGSGVTPGPLPGAPIIFSFNPCAQTNNAVDYTAAGGTVITYSRLEAGSVSNLRDLNGVPSTTSVHRTRGSIGADDKSTPMSPTIASMFPTDAGRTHHWMVPHEWGGDAMLEYRFSGLDEDMLFTFEFYANRTSTVNETARYTLTGETTACMLFDAASNASQLIVFDQALADDGMVYL